MTTKIRGVQLDASALESGVADGATADAFTLDTTNAFTTAGASLLTLKTNAVEKVSIECNTDANDYYSMKFHDTEAIPTNFYVGYHDTDSKFAGIMTDFSDILLGKSGSTAMYFNFYNGESIIFGDNANLQKVTCFCGPLTSSGFNIRGALFTEKVIETAVSIASTGAVIIDLDTATYFSNIATTGIITFTFSNPSATALSASRFTLELFGGGTNAPVWPGSVKWPGGTEPTWSVGIDIINFVTRDGGTTWYGVLEGANFA